MIRTDEDALICDMAETYHVFDWRSLPVKTVATLAAGLRDNARIKMIYRGDKLPLETILTAMLVDGINQLCWLNSEDGRHGRNRPKSITEMITKDNHKADVVVFDSGAEFEARRRALLNGN